MKPILEVKNVKKDYTLGQTIVPALRGVSFTVQEGELLCLVGPSGSGKTTLLNIVGTLDRPTSGDVWVAGEKVTVLSDKEAAHLRHSYLGFIFQTFNLIPVLNVFENVEFPLVIQNGRQYKKQKKDFHQDIKRLLNEVGIYKYKDHLPDELSGGQRQRVAIARALITKPELVLADEPTANLDSKTAQTIVDLMIKMNQQHKTTFIFSTHDTQLIGQIPRKITLQDGKIA